MAVETVSTWRAHGGTQEAAPPAGTAVTYLDMPEILSNLNAPGRRGTFIRLRSKLELARPEDMEAARQAMPRLLDLFQTYLREMRPEELRGSIGTHRLREELIARANNAAAPARVTDVLFTEIHVQSAARRRKGARTISRPPGVPRWPRPWKGSRRCRPRRRMPPRS